MSAIECHQLGLAEPLYDGKHRCVHETQSEIPVSIKKLANAHIVVYAELHHAHPGLLHVQQEAEERLRLKTPASQPVEFHHHRCWHQHLLGGRLYQLRAGQMISVGPVHGRKERPGVADQRQERGS